MALEEVEASVVTRACGSVFVEDASGSSPSLGGATGGDASEVVGKYVVHSRPLVDA
jgi:hypothetical protein